MEKAVIYARYSSHNQREVSIEQQVNECRREADRGNFDVIKVYSDKALTGKNDNRPQFQKMISDSDKHQWTVLIVYAIDRFARNRYDSAIYKARLKKNGVRVVYATGSIPDTPEGIILESVMEGYAEFYSENLSRSIKRGLSYNAENGLAVGKPSLGYRIENHRYVIDEPKAELVRKIYQWYDEGVSTTQIAARLNDMGVTTMTGKPFNRGSFQSIFTNVRYKGVYKVGDMVIPDGIPSIVDSDLWERVNAKYSDNAQRKAHYKAKAEYLLSGKLYCGHCKSLMTGESGASRNGTVYNYYKCAARKKNARLCDKKPVLKDWIEDLVVQEVSQRILTPTRIREISEKAHAIMVEESQHGIRQTIEQELKDTQVALNNLLKAIERGIVFPTTKSRMEELECHKAQLQDELEDLNVTQPVLSVEQIEFWLTKYLAGDIKNKNHHRKIIDTLVNKVYLYDLPDGGKRITVICNLSDNNTFDVSNIEGFAPHHNQYSNHLFYIGQVVGFTTEVV